MAMVHHYINVSGTGCGTGTGCGGATLSDFQVKPPPFMAAIDSDTNVPTNIAMALSRRK